ncbi:Site-specific recombinase XerD [Mesobacillus persicus]|uniref:Site-specific recombinase XerD n=1 Tax=Mesobacillus persicus TaxID=930146 RepID=A0A1H8D0H5_9BACI|nr:site-specific integrase [Mesobacillus persicus]SEN00770.1 Site-specific recombinase XerD [Mesobacillus persicus]
METDQLFEDIAKFKDFLKRDYKPSTIDRYSKALFQFLKWRNAKTSNDMELKSSIMDYLNPQNHFCIIDLNNVRPALHLYYFLISGTKFKSIQTIQNESIELEVTEYVTYLSKVVGLTDSTQISHKNFLKRFFYYLSPNQRFDSSMLTVDSVQNYFANELKHLKPSSKKRVIGILRSYIRYLRFKGFEIDSGLFALPLHTPVWKLSNVPNTFEKEDINIILSSYDLTSLVGIRDYAIALCFTELGLRTSEVASLTLDDFNWHEGKLLVKKTKTHKERELPLPKKIGEAIVIYLQISRPKTSSRTLFVRFSHQCGEPMGREQIRGTIRRAYARAGISLSITGTHILRHSKARFLYEEGSSLKIIADILGHESIDTTVIYTKVGRSALQCVVCPWPETICLEEG